MGRNLEVDRLLAEGRVRVRDPRALVPVYETVHRPRPARRALPEKRGRRPRAMLRAERAEGSRLTRPSYGRRKRLQRARNKIAKASRRRNR